MSSITEYWAKVREVQAGLTGEAIYITSLDNSTKGTTSGRVFRIGPRKAAERIVEQTHRVSTKAEMKAFHEKIVADRKKHDAVVLAKKQQFAMPQELTEVVQAAAVMINQGGTKKPSAA